MRTTGRREKHVSVLAVERLLPCEVVSCDDSGFKTLDQKWATAFVEAALPGSEVIAAWDRLAMTPELAHGLFCCFGGCDLPLAEFASRFVDRLGSSVADVHRGWLEYHIARDFFDSLAAYGARYGAGRRCIDLRIPMPARYWHDPPELLTMMGACDHAVQQATTDAGVRFQSSVLVSWARRKTHIEEALVDHCTDGDGDDFAALTAAMEGLCEDDIMLIDHGPVAVECNGFAAIYDPRATSIETEDGEGMCPRQFAVSCGVDPKDDWKEALLMATPDCAGVTLAAWMRWIAL